MSNSFQQEEQARWVRVGAVQGGGRGLCLAFSYMFLPTLLSGLTALLWVGEDLNAPMNGGTSSLLTEPEVILGGVMGVLFVGIFYIIFGIGIGVIPATIIGALSGALLGAVLSLPHIAPYRWNRIGIGVGLSVLIAAIISQGALMIFEDGTVENWGPYLFFLGVPSLVFVAVCAWLSDRFPALVAADAKVLEFPVRSRLNAPVRAE